MGNSEPPAKPTTRDTRKDALPAEIYALSLHDDSDNELVLGELSTDLEESNSPRRIPAMLRNGRLPWAIAGGIGARGPRYGLR